MTIAMLLTLHLICVALSVSLFVARYWWRYCGHALAAARWTRIVPPVIDTLLLLSGIGLIVKTHILPFTESGSWLTEKLFGVIIYIVLGFIALDYRQARSQQARFYRFPAGAGGAVHHH
ncbi:regulator [Salmonella enterica subsp. enterica serovar Daytona]|uniref:Regulator n=1 Tax=Salmonella enterica subsp. enterica serovar Daytona TaxID=1962639 RepID=A0A447JIX9_SALET|nr:regulator [Salmonella enterica subsp. enterica serovar Daytona]